MNRPKKHYAKRDTWINASSPALIPTECGEETSLPYIHHYPRYEDFLQSFYQRENICCACMAARWDEEKKSVLSYIAPKKNKRAMETAEKIFNAATGREYYL